MDSYKHSDLAELLCSLAWGGKFDALVKLLDNNMKLLNEPNRRGQSALVSLLYFFPESYRSVLWSQTRTLGYCDAPDIGRC